MQTEYGGAATALVVITEVNAIEFPKLSEVVVGYMLPVGPTPHIMRFRRAAGPVMADFDASPIALIHRWTFAH